MSKTISFDEMPIFEDLNVLILDDADEQIASIRSAIELLYPGANPVHATSVKDTIQHLNERYWDIVLLDLDMDRDLDFRDRADKHSAGFYPYFHLHSKLSTYIHNLPPLVLLYTGHSEIYKYFQPFMDSQLDAPVPGVDLSRPFAIVHKGGGILEGFEKGLGIQEKERFRSHIHQFNLRHRLFSLIDDLENGFTSDVARELGNENLYGELPLRKIIPTLYARILETAGDTLSELKGLLEGYDRLYLLNCLFIKDKPGSRLLHSDETNSNWQGFLEDLKKLPEALANMVIKDLYGERKVPEDLSSNPPWTAPNFSKTSERFKAKWSRWGDGPIESTLTRWITDEIVRLLIENGHSSIEVDLLTPQVDSQSRLYVEPSLMANIARDVVTNAVENAWEPSEEGRLIWVIPIDDRNNGTFSLNIVDNGKGFKYPLIAWQSPFNSFNKLHKMLSGWAMLEVYTKFEGGVFRITPDRYKGEECDGWPLEPALLSELGSVGTIVRIVFNKRGGWEYQT